MAEPLAPSMPRGADGKVPHWFLIAGGGVAIVALFVYFKNRQTSTGGETVAAGTSINAALGSLQEQVLNVQGDVSRANVGISTVGAQVADVQNVQTNVVLPTINNSTAFLANNQATYAQNIADQTTYAMNTTDAAVATAGHQTSASTGTF